MGLNVKILLLTTWLEKKNLNSSCKFTLLEINQKMLLHDDFFILHKKNVWSKFYMDKLLRINGGHK